MFASSGEMTPPCGVPVSTPQSALLAFLDLRRFSSPIGWVGAGGLRRFSSAMVGRLDLRRFSTVMATELGQ